MSRDLDKYATAVWMGYRQRMAVGALVVQRQYSTLWPWRSEFDSRPRHFSFFFLRWRCSLPLCRLSVSAAPSLSHGPAVRSYPSALLSLVQAGRTMLVVH